jgi:DNA mismatch repair protein MutS
MTLLTPMQRQYLELKKESPDTLLFFRLGDFYELFLEDAKKASQILGITLTARNKGRENEMEMCGIPHHSADKYIKILIEAGEKVALCEQVSDPSLPGIVERKIVRIITPGTFFEGNEEHGKTSQFLVALVEHKNEYGIAYADIASGKFLTTTVFSFEEMVSEIERISPQEIIIERESSFVSDMKNKARVLSFWDIPQNPQEVLETFFNIPHIKLFSLENEETALVSSAFLASYIQETQKNSISSFTRIEKYSFQEILPLGKETLRNLELFSTLYEGKKEGSLFSLLDHTKTSGGGRLLFNRMLYPLKNKEALETRLKVLEQYTKNPSKTEEMRKLLESFPDIERILSKISYKKATPKDIGKLRDALLLLPKIQRCKEEIYE